MALRLKEAAATMTEDTPAARHVRRTERLVARQLRLVERLERGPFAALVPMAQRVLRRLTRCLALARDDLQREREEPPRS